MEGSTIVISCHKKNIKYEYFKPQTSVCATNESATKFLQWKSNEKCFEFYNKKLNKKKR